MLLAVIDLFDRGHLRENRIPFDSELVHQFELIFRERARANDWCQAGPPFFHLRTAGFWKHQIKAGRQSAYDGITRVGGSTRLITDNIEYAYLRDDVFGLLSNTESRNELRAAIVRLLEQEDSRLSTDSAGRLNIAFHESFPVVIPALAQVVRVVAEAGPAGIDTGALADVLKARTSLGPNYIRAMPRWGRGTGILDGVNRLTALGRVALARDPALSSAATLWAMHYHMSAPQGPGPCFWNYLISTILRPGDEIETARLAEGLDQYVTKNEQREIAGKTLKATASVFLGTYSKSDALGPLGILEQVHVGRYLAKEPEPPSLWAFAYALANFWQANWGAATGVNVSRVSEAGGPGSLLLMGSGSVNRYLGELQAAGFAVVQRRRPPFQLNRNWPDPAVFLERLYD